MTKLRVRSFALLLATLALSGCAVRGGGSKKPPPLPPAPVLRNVEFIIRDQAGLPVDQANVILQGGAPGGDCSVVTNGDGYTDCPLVSGSLTATTVIINAYDYAKHADLPLCSSFPCPKLVVYVGAPNDGGPTDVHLDAVSRPGGGGVGGSRGLHVGPIRADGSHSFVDDLGDLIPTSFHTGDLFWLYTQHPEQATSFLDKVAQAGYHVVRSWAILHDKCDPNDFWGYLCVGPRNTPDWRGQMVGFGKELAKRGLVWHLSLGGYEGMSDDQLRAAYGTIADAIDQFGEANVIFAGEINEAFFNADHRSPASVESFVNIIRARHPNNAYALSHVMGTEDANVIKQWTPGWMTFYALGGSGRSPAQAWYDLAHHNFGDGYEGPSTVVRRLWYEFEGDDRPDINAAQWGVIKAAVAIAHGVPDVFLPGSARIGRDGDPSANPAFWSIPALINMLPGDLSRFPSLEHIGDPAGRPWRRPISDCGEGTRGEYARDPGSGRFVLVVYLNGGRPGAYSCRVEAGFQAKVIPPDHPDQAYDVDLNTGQTFQFNTATGFVVSGKYK